MNTRTLSCAALLLSLLAPASALATSSSAACCLASTSRLDNLVNPTTGSDEQFFTAGGGMPNVVWVLDTSCSMANWPSTWPTIKGCPAVNPTGSYVSPTTGRPFAAAYDPTKTYFPIWKGTQPDGSNRVTDQNTDWFDATKSYVAGPSGFGTDTQGQPKASVGTPFGPSLTGFNAGYSADSACDIAALNLSATDVANCKTCLATNGYFSMGGLSFDALGFTGITLRGIAAGNFLNFYAPRDVGMLNAVSHVIHDRSDMRFAVQTYDKPDKAGPHAGDCFAGGKDEVCTMIDIGDVKCSDSANYDPTNPVTVSQRNSILGKIAGSGVHFGADTPSADALYAAAFYFHGFTTSESSAKDPFAGWFDDYPNKNGKVNRSNKFEEDPSFDGHSVCFTCTYNAVLFLTDGNPHNETYYVDIPDEIRGQAGVTCPGCAQNLVDNGILGCSNGGGCARTSYLPHVAKWFWEHDIRSDDGTASSAGHPMPGVQKVATYTIGFSETVDSSSLLQRTAELGGGKFFGATDISDLEAALNAALDDVHNRAIGFSSAAVPALQTSRATIGAVIPRVLPSRDSLWTGQLWRFDIYNEFVEDNDLNANGNKGDVFVVDKDQSIIIEDPNSGAFIKQADGNPANPHWEASARLLANGHTSRNMWTVVDNSGDNLLTDADNLVDFKPVNASTLGPYMGIWGTSFCPKTDGALPPNISLGDLFTKLNLSVDTARTNTYTLTSMVDPTKPTQDELNLLCARVLIQYIRGQDLGDENADGDLNDTRATVMGDIFHSSPVTVDPPVDPFLCELGISSQCIRTLYSDKLGTTPTPQANYNDLPACNGAGGTTQRNAYQEWSYKNRRRTKTTIVGANDGMIHAFNNGQATTDNCGAGNTVNVAYNVGTGDEIWAFIPPDQLPKLLDRAVLNHEYYVDGDLMVRDVWVDGSGQASPTTGAISGAGANDNTKQWNEFHTMVIAAEGRGGNHYVALELLPDNGTNPATRPGFRWMYPQPCSNEATEFGKTFYALAPKAPPVGPILLSQDTGSSITGLGSTPVVRTITGGGNLKTTERWVATLSGGWEPSLMKGRGIYMVDAYWGTVNNRSDNLWWKWDFDDTDTTTSRQYMMYSIAAPVSMVDYDANQANHNGDGFFDTAVVGDTGGQIWVGRFYQPGVAASGGLISNWSMARGFQMDKSTLADQNVANRNPFFYIPSVILQPDNGAMRIYMGSGNRYALLDNNAGTCRYDNPLACAKYKCEYDAQYSVARDTLQLDNDRTHWNDRIVKTADFDRNATAVAMAACATVNAKYDNFKVKSCEREGGGGDFGDHVLDPRITCQVQDGASGNYACVRTNANNDKVKDLFTNPKQDKLHELGLNRFYGIWIYGGGDATHQYDETTNSTAMSFDGARLTDTDLVNVTATTCSNTSCTGNQASNTGKGWFLEYLDNPASTYPLNNSSIEDSLKHKTASGSTVLASCVLWNSIFPFNSASTGACAQTSVSKSRLFQADVFTGSPNCAAGFLNTAGTSYNRYQERNVVAPPTQPGDAPQISKTGAIKYGVMSIEPGQNQPVHVDVNVSNEPFQAVYELPLSRGMHNCRHNDPTSCRPMAP